MILKSYWPLVASLTIMLLWQATMILGGCYKCKTPDCSELPPGGGYPSEATPKLVLDAGLEGGRP